MLLFKRGRKIAKSDY